MKRPVLLLGCLSALLFFVSSSSVAQTIGTETYSKAIRFATLENYSAAMQTAKTTADPKLIKLIEWFRLTNTKQVPDFEQAESFIQKNPDWPRIYLIRRNAEQALINSEKKNALEKWFKKHPPVSPKAVLAYATLLLEKKEWEKAMPMLHALWGKSDLSEEESEIVLEKLSFMLDERDFADRTEKLLDERKASQARRLIPFVPDHLRKLFQTRVDLITNTQDIKKRIKELPSYQQRNQGLLFDQVRWLRQNGKYSTAAKFLERIPPEKQKTPRWWTEKAALVRQFLTDQDSESAYNVAKKHHLPKGSDFADAEWTAGWIALRNLKKPAKAAEHFQNMLEAVSSPLSISRGQYWLGRTYEEMNKKELAQFHYAKAAEKITTIYGQLAAQKISAEKPFPALPAQKEPTSEQMAQLRKSELFAVTTMLQNAKQYDLVDLFAMRLYNDAKTPEDITALALVLSQDLKRDDLAVTISRRARQNDIDLVTLGYPVWNIKHDEKTEKAIVLSIIRQESSFSPQAVSPAGARGLMQIMPATGKQIAQRKKKPFTPQLLNSNPEFNVEIGSAYFAELLKRFDGSYILAIAAYNAGPTNVNRWLRSIGKPEEDIDPIDWIERIPFSETRNYVQRVLENLHIYRRHLNYPETELGRWIQKQD